MAEPTAKRIPSLVCPRYCIRNASTAFNAIQVNSSSRARRRCWKKLLRTIRTKLDQAARPPIHRVPDSIFQPAFLSGVLLLLLLVIAANRRTSAGLSLFLYFDAAPLFATLVCLGYLGFSKRGRQIVAATLQNQKAEKRKAWRTWHDISLSVWVLQLFTIPSVPMLLPMAQLTILQTRRLDAL